MMQRSLFVVEGPHDEAALGRLLRVRDLEPVVKLSELDPFWSRLVPTKFPHNDDLRTRMPVPSFYRSEQFSVAVHSAIGVENLLNRTLDSLMVLDNAPQGLGLLLDSDDHIVEKVWAQISSKLQQEDAVLFQLGAGPGKVGTGAMRAGVFILPNNAQGGTLENLLLDCAAQSYPLLLQAARSWIEPLNPDNTELFINGTERQDLKKPAGKNKAIVGAIANVLRPGKAVQVSIQDNRWLKDKNNLSLPQIAALQQFVDGVLGYTP